MKTLAAMTVLAGAWLLAGTAHAQCKETDGYVFVSSQCQQQEAEGEDMTLCDHKPGADPAFMYFVSNVILDSAEDRSSLGSLFFHVARGQHGVELNGTPSQCFETAEAAETHRANTIERYRESFENVVVKQVEFEKGAGAPETVRD